MRLSAAHIDQLGVQGGGDFVAARRAAEAVGAQIVLGDRPIEITLQRAWEALPWGRWLQLCWELLLAGLTRPTDREVRSADDPLTSSR